MPTYRVTDPQSGKTLRLTGDSPPTEQELSQVFGATTQPATPKSAGELVKGFAGNVVKSGAQFVGDTANAIIHPIATVKNVASAVGTTEGRRAIGDYYKQRYGQDLGKTLYEDPVGVLADASTILGGAGAVLKGVGTAGKVSALSKAGKVASTASKISDPLKVAGKVTRAVASPVARPIGNVFRRVGSNVSQGLINASDNIATAGYGQPGKLGAVKKLAGRPIPEFFDQYGLWDRSPETMQRALDMVDSQRSGMIAKSTAKVRVQELMQAFNDEIERLKSAATESDVAADQLAELVKRRDRFVEAITREGATPLEVSAERIGKSQSFVGGDVKANQWTPGASMTGRGQGTKQAFRLFQDTTEKYVPGTKRLGRDEAALMTLRELSTNTENRAAARQTLNFSKMGGAAVAGATFKSAPAAIGGFIAEQLANSPAGSRIISKTLRSAGNKIKDAKMPKAPVWAKKAYKAGKAGRMFNRGSSGQ